MSRGTGGSGVVDADRAHYPEAPPLRASSVLSTALLRTCVAWQPHCAHMPFSDQAAPLSSPGEEPPMKIVDSKFNHQSQVLSTVHRRPFNCGHNLYVALVNVQTPPNDLQWPVGRREQLAGCATIPTGALDTRGPREPQHTSAARRLLEQCHRT